MRKLLIDSDVILDLFFERKPHSDSASEIFILCEKGKIKGFVTPVICSNIYYILRRVASHPKVIEKLNQLLNIVDVLSMDKEVVLSALGSGFKDFEDALQNFAAERSQLIDAIVTRNVKDYAKSEIGVHAPDSFLKLLHNQ
mgnify:CR=1 FL=1